MFEQKYLGNSLYDWIVAGAAALAVTSAILAVRWFLIQRGQRERSTDESGNLVAAGENLLARLARRTWTLTAVTAGIEAGSTVLSHSVTSVLVLTRIGYVVLILQLGVWGTVLASVLIENVFNPANRRRHSEGKSTGVIQFIANLIVWSVVLLVGLQNLGVDVSAALAGFGVGGIAVALATQSLLGDLIASVSIVFDEPFKPGDFVVIGDNAGTVKNVGFRTTRMQSLSGELLVLSNNDVQKSRIQNFRHLEERRVVFHFGVTYSTPASRLREISGWVREIIEGLEHVRFDRCHFQKFGDWDLRFETVYFVIGPDYLRYMDIQQDINFALIEKFGRKASTSRSQLERCIRPALLTHTNKSVRVRTDGVRALRVLPHRGRNRAL